MSQPYKVFISSTYRDNEQRRAVVEDAILAAGMTPIGMERFTASTRPTVDECLSFVAESDVVVFILAFRYGWIPDGFEESITELEYNASKQRLVFVLDETLTEEKVDRGQDRWEKQGKLDALKCRASGDQMPAKFKDHTLGQRVLEALQKWKRKQEGVVQSGVEAANLTDRETVLVGHLRDKIARLAECGPGTLPYTLIGGTYLDVLLDPVTTTELGPHEWINLSAPDIRLGGSAICVGRFLHEFYEKKSHLFTAVGASGEQGDAFTREYHKLLADDRVWIASENFAVGSNEGCAVTILLYQSDDEFQTMFTYPGALRSFTWGQIGAALSDVVSGQGGVVYLSGFLKTSLHKGLEKELSRHHDTCLICIDHGRLRPENPQREALESLARTFRRGLIDFYICTFEEIYNFYSVLKGADDPDDLDGDRDAALTTIANSVPLPPATFVRGDDVYQGDPLLSVISGGTVTSIPRPQAWAPGGTIGPKNAFNAAVLHSALVEPCTIDFADYCTRVARHAILKCHERSSHDVRFK